MTDLTDKWKKGELPEGLYYFKLSDGEIIAGTDYCLTAYLLTKDNNKCEVLYEVPSYEQWQANLEENTKLKTENKWYSEQLNEAVKEVGQLKGLLKECYVPINEYSIWDESDILHKISQVLGEE